MLFIHSHCPWTEGLIWSCPLEDLSLSTVQWTQRIGINKSSTPRIYRGWSHVWCLGLKDLLTGSVLRFPLQSLIVRRKHSDLTDWISPGSCRHPLNIWYINGGSHFLSIRWGECTSSEAPPPHQIGTRRPISLERPLPSLEPPPPDQLILTRRTLSVATFKMKFKEIVLLVPWHSLKPINRIMPLFTVFYRY